MTGTEPFLKPVQWTQYSGHRRGTVELKKLHYWIQESTQDWFVEVFENCTVYKGQVKKIVLKQY